MNCYGELTHRGGITVVRIATWNLNHRVGTTRFRHDAAKAVVALQADIVVLTEYYPKEHHAEFCAHLFDAGFTYVLASDPGSEVANRVLIVSTLLIEPFHLPPPTFDRQFPANMLAVTVPELGCRVLGLRSPAYVSKDRSSLLASWDWLENATQTLHDAPTIVLGDLNAHQLSPRSRGGEHFRRLLACGWQLATPSGEASYFGPQGRRSKVDHMLCNRWGYFTDACYVTEANEWRLAGGVEALSDHAALVARYRS